MKVFCCFILGWQIPDHNIKGEDESEARGLRGYRRLVHFNVQEQKHQEHQVVKWRFQDLRMSGSRNKKQFSSRSHQWMVCSIFRYQEKKLWWFRIFPNEGLHLEKKCLEIVPFDVWMVSTFFCRSGGRCHNVDKLSHRISMGKVKSKISEE